MRDVAEFFDLPLEAKKEWAQRPDSVQGYGQAFVVSEDQKLDWADMLHLQLQPSESRDLRVWPTRPQCPSGNGNVTPFFFPFAHVRVNGSTNQRTWKHNHRRRKYTNQRHDIF